MGKHRIALATTDRLTIYQHFGRAKGYEITEVDTDTGRYAYLGFREVAPPCNAGGHSTGAFDVVLEKLSDCEAIVVAQIGSGAADYVLSKGMRVFEAPGVVENIIKTMVDKNMLPGGKAAE